MRLAVGGAVTGIVLAYAASALLRGFLFGVSATDPLIYATITFFLLAVALTACLAPAWPSIRSWR